MISTDEQAVIAYTIVLMAIAGWRYKSETGFRGMVQVALAFCLSMLSVFGLNAVLELGASDDDLTILNGVPILYVPLGVAALIFYTTMTALFKSEQNSS